MFAERGFYSATRLRSCNSEIDWPNPAEAPNKGEPACKFALRQISKSLSFRLSGLLPNPAAPGRHVPVLSWDRVLGRQSSSQPRSPGALPGLGYLFVGQSGRREDDNGWAVTEGARNS